LSCLYRLQRADELPQLKACEPRRSRELALEDLPVAVMGSALTSMPQIGAPTKPGRGSRSGSLNVATGRVIRESVRLVMQELIEAEATERIGAPARDAAGGGANSSRTRPQS